MFETVKERHMDDLNKCLNRIRRNLDHDELIKHDSWIVRSEIARFGHHLDTLIKDPHWFVRAIVARQGYKLDTLIKDPHWFVRSEVAEIGYGLDQLVDDPDIYVRHIALKVRKTNES